MNINNLQKSNIFNTDSSENINSRQTAEMAIVNMRFYGKELVRNYNDYLKEDPSSRIAVVLFDAMRMNLNDYVQTFIDAISALCFTPSGTLRAMVRSFTSEYNLNWDVKSWVDFLVRRNDLIHDYLNRDFLNDELLSALLNYETCILELVDFIETKLRENNLMNVKVHKK